MGVLRPVSHTTEVTGYEGDGHQEGLSCPVQNFEAALKSYCIFLNYLKLKVA